MRSPNTIQLDAKQLATGALDPVAGTEHEHNGKNIGEKFPAKGYGEDTPKSGRRMT